MKRDEWKFTYTADVLAGAASKKKLGHEAKLKWWEAKKVETMDKVREGGIDVHDSVAASYSNTKGGFGPQITIDSNLQRDLTECQSKIHEHTNKVKDYDGWLQVLNRAGLASFELDHEDWLFFFSE